MSVRKRSWVTDKGEQKSAWVADYVDAKGVRRQKTFRLKKQADAFAATATVEVREGVHVADSDSVTVEAAGKFWLASCVSRGLERSTVDQYRQHLQLHIVPLIGGALLSKMTVPAVRSFEDLLRETNRSPAMVRKVLVSLGSLLADAQERGFVVRNAVREKSRARTKGTERRQARRHKGKLKVGIDIPSPVEMRAIISALDGHWRPLLLTAIFTGMRASELRGLHWSDVNLEEREIRVHRRADRFNEIGKPKSEAGERTIPVPPIVINTLREWRLSYPRPFSEERDADGNRLRERPGDAHLVFPNGKGKIESLANIINRGLIPVQIVADIADATDEVDEYGMRLMRARYTGMHALRHFYASWCINRPTDGGLGLPAKVVQERLGHSTIVMTMDVYGHLFPRGDDADELAAAERALLG